jgi:iron complex transport system permease protein
MNKPTLFALLLILGFIGISALYLLYDIADVRILSALRLPRYLLTLLAGGVLAGVGYIFQIMLNNPLAEPYILGVSSGAAFGGILASITGILALMPILGFAGALLTMAVVWMLAHLGGNFSTTRLLLAGIIMGFFFSSLISLLMYFNQQDISAILSILMGNLGHIFTMGEWRIFLAVAAVSLLLLGYLTLAARKLLVLTTGEITASSMGINVSRLRLSIFVVCSILTGMTVAYAGIIGFVGLVVPHLVRMLARTNRPALVPISVIGGAVLLLICDFIAMHIAIVEIPVGIVTAFIGCPFFIVVMARSR